VQRGSYSHDLFQNLPMRAELLSGIASHMSQASMQCTLIRQKRYQALNVYLKGNVQAIRKNPAFLPGEPFGLRGMMVEELE
jgi:hypothetical protein